MVEGRESNQASWIIAKAGYIRLLSLTEQRLWGSGLCDWDDFCRWGRSCTTCTEVQKQYLQNFMHVLHERRAISRRKGVKVIFGGIATMLHAEETMTHADSVFIGEAEGRMEEVFADFKKGRLQKVYNYLEDRPPIEMVGTARRDILKRDLYNYKGIQMVDLVHASRGCRFHCYPCAVAYLGGKQFRPRPIDKVIRRDGRHRQQPPVYRGQFPGPGYPMGNGLVSGNDPLKEKMVQPSHRGQAGGAGSGRPGRRLVCLPGRF